MKISKFKIILSIFIVILLFSACNSNKDKEFSEIYVSNPASLLKKGDYTFHFKEGENYLNEFKVFFKSEKSPIIDIKTKAFFALINDEKVYYIQGDEEKNTSKIIQLDLKTKIANTIKTLQGSTSASLNYAHGEDIYLSIWLENPENKGMYICSLNKIDTNKGEIIKVIDNAMSSKVGKEKIFYQQTAYDYGAYPLYSSDFKGKDIKEISKNVVFYKPMDNKIYFIELDMDNSKTGLYIANEDASEKKQLSENIDGSFFVDIKPKSVVYSKYDENEEKFTFYEQDISSGKVKQIKEPEFDNNKKQ